MTISPKKSTTPRGLTTWVISKCFVVSSNSCERLINFIHNQHLSRYALRKCADTLLDHRWPVSSPFLRPLARRRVYQWAWPVSDLQLPTFLAGIKLYCLVTEAYVCKQLAQIHYMKAKQWRLEPRPLDHMSNTLNITTSCHTLQCIILQTR